MTTPSEPVSFTLSKVQKALADVGIAKSGWNDFDKYAFRGIDAVLNALAPILAEHQLLIIPSTVSHTTTAVATKSGGSQNHSVVEVDYTIYNKFGESITHKMTGEGMDRGDKSINKALSAAFKSFVFQALCVPLQGDDSEQHSPELAAPGIDSDDQASLALMLKDTGTDEGDFVKWITKGAAENLKDLPADFVEPAKKALKRKAEVIARRTNQGDQQ